VARVLIVAKTHMASGVCIGGLTREGNKSVRLIPSDRRNHPADTPYDIGQVWDLDFHPSPEVIPPHVEDVIVTKERYIAQVPNLLETLTQRVQPWKGSPNQLFDDLLTISDGRGYISENRVVPNVSTGFWLLDKPLILNYPHGNPKPFYRSDFEIEVVNTLLLRRGVLNIPYVGFAPPIDQIPAGTLIRVSLARWWAPDGTNEKRCYLQLSGWYL
jgi:hypothetical protein